MTIKALTNRLARVESTYKRILQCDSCRYFLRQTSSLEARRLKNSPADMLTGKCCYCGARFRVSVAGLDKYDRMITAIIINSHPSERFTDERVHAAFTYKRLKLKERGSSLPKAKPMRSLANLTAAEQRKVQERDQLKARALEFRRQQVERIAKIAKGPTSFPIDETIRQIEIEHHIAHYGCRFTQMLDLDINDPRGTRLEEKLEALVHNLCTLKKRMACEKIIFRKPLSKTVQENESLELEVKKEFENAVNSYREEKAHREREGLKREGLERERLALERDRSEGERASGARVELENRLAQKSKSNVEPILRHRGPQYPAGHILTPAEEAEILEHLDKQMRPFVDRINQMGSRPLKERSYRPYRSPSATSTPSRFQRPGVPTKR